MQPSVMPVTLISNCPSELWQFLGCVVPLGVYRIDFNFIEFSKWVLREFGSFVSVDNKLAVYHAFYLRHVAHSKAYRYPLREIRPLSRVV